ncbi:MAG TPA: hypothetical protein VG841_12885 [Caulobacterales bacterium]|nr:hypothetical protein [Caulobacterales bacterium]
MGVPVLYQVGGSAAVIAVMVAAAALMGFRTAARIDADALERLVAETEPDARVVDMFVAANGAAGLARLGDGRILAARVMGGDISTRLVQAKALRLRLTRDRLSVTFGDIGYPPLHFALKAAAPPDWIIRLAGEGASP